MAGSSLAAAGFVWRIADAEQPFAPPDLFANRSYVFAVIVAFFSMFAYFAVLVFVPLLVVEANGLTPGQAGMIPPSTTRRSLRLRPIGSASEWGCSRERFIWEPERERA